MSWLKGSYLLQIMLCWFSHSNLLPPNGVTATNENGSVVLSVQQILFTGNKTQVIPTTVAAPTPAQAQIPAAGQQQPQQQQAQPQAPLVLQVDGAGDTSSEEEEDEEEDYDDDEEEDKEKDGGEDGQVEEVKLTSFQKIAECLYCIFNFFPTVLKGKL